MKLATVTHPKTLALSAILGLARYETVGLLECLWHFTSQQAPRGDIGRWSPEAIAEAVGWRRDPHEMVAALVKAGFLDQTEEHGLIVHDWHDHAGRSVRRRSIVQRLGFIGQPGPPAPVQRSLPLRPSPPKKTATKPRAAVNRATTKGYSEEFERFWRAFPPGRKVKKRKAAEAFAKALKSVPASLLVTRAEQYAKSPVGKSKYVMQPTTWLNGACWEDEPTAWLMETKGDDAQQPDPPKLLKLAELAPEQGPNQ